MPELTAEMIVDGLSPSDPRISPDGQFVAFVVAPASRKHEHPQSSVWLVAADGSAQPRRLTPGEAEDKTPRWSPDGDWLYFLSDRSERSKAQLYRLPVRGPGEAEALTDWKPGLSGFSPLPDGEGIAVLAEDVPSEEEERRKEERDDAEVFGDRWPYRRLRLLDVSAREIWSVDLGERHVAEVAADPTGERLAVITWPTPELDNSRHPSELYLVDLASEECRLVCELPSGGGGVVWHDDGRTLLYLGGVAPGVTTGLAVFGVGVAANGTQGKPRILTEGLQACPMSLCTGRSPGSGALTAVARGLDTTLERLQPESGELVRLFRHTGELHSLTVSDAGAGVAAIKSGPDALPEVWAGPPEGPMHRLTNLSRSFGA